jgi:hypothetical protein
MRRIVSIRDTAETRAATLVDIPLVRRLSEQVTVLDSELAFTRNASGPQGARFFALLLPYRGVHTLVTRSEKCQVVGQFRLRDSHYAHIAYIAPTLEEDEDDTVWMHILDSMAVEAGKRGAHILVAEVDELAPLFKTMRLASYSIYARQEIWERPPGDYSAFEPALKVELAETSESDLPGIQLLYGNVVPRLVQQITGLPNAGQGLVYRKDERVEGFIGVAEGKAGVYLTPHLHPDVFSDASAILASAIAQVGRSSKVPVYVRVRRYQDWLDSALVDLGFEIGTRQAVMVKHITAGIRSAAFAPLSHRLEAVPSPVKPPTNRSSFQLTVVSSQLKDEWEQDDDKLHVDS